MSELSELSKRIDRLEENLLHIPKEINESADRAIQRAVDIAISKIGARRSTDVSDKKNGSNATGTMVSFISIIIALSASLIGAVFIGQGKAIEVNERRQNEHMRIIGHPGMLERNSRSMEKLENLIKRIDFLEQKGWLNQEHKGHFDAVQNEKLRWLEKGANYVPPQG